MCAIYRHGQHSPFVFHIQCVLADSNSAVNAVTVVVYHDHACMLINMQSSHALFSQYSGRDAEMKQTKTTVFTTEPACLTTLEMD